MSFKNKIMIIHKLKWVDLTQGMYKTISFCAQGSRELRKFLRYVDINLSKTMQNIVNFD